MERDGQRTSPREDHPGQEPGGRAHCSGSLNWTGRKWILSSISCSLRLKMMVYINERKATQIKVKRYVFSMFEFHNVCIQSWSGQGLACRVGAEMQNHRQGNTEAFKYFLSHGKQSMSQSPVKEPVRTGCCCRIVQLKLQDCPACSLVFFFFFMHQLHICVCVRCCNDPLLTRHCMEMKHAWLYIIWQRREKFCKQICRKWLKHIKRH